MSDQEHLESQWPPPSTAPPPSEPIFSKPRAESGGLIAAGIVSIFCIGFLLGPAVWIEATLALRGIRRGEFDPRHRIAYEVARILGVLGTLSGTYFVIGSVMHGP